MTTKPVLIKESILVDQNFSDLNQSIDTAGNLLLENGYIESEYITSMKEKVLEHPYTTYLPGAGVAIPHGMSDGFKFIKHTGISVLQIPDGVDWIDEKVYVVIAIAANSDEHMNVLASLSDALESEEDAKKLWKTNSVDELFSILSNQQ
tara:strand:- start:74 stop:520 length:447 start_codon:yes stop_codon:yes gene_type:complete